MNTSYKLALGLIFMAGTVTAQTTSTTQQNPQVNTAKPNAVTEEQIFNETHDYANKNSSYTNPNPNTNPYVAPSTYAYDYDYGAFPLESNAQIFPADSAADNMYWDEVKSMESN